MSVKVSADDNLTPPPSDFWSFPETVEPAERSGLWFLGNTPDLDFVKVVGFRITWADMNPQEGVYDFSMLENYLAMAEENDLSVVLRLTSSVVRRNTPYTDDDARAPFIPAWVIQKHNPPQFNTYQDSRGYYIKVAAPWDQNVQNELKRFISEFGSRGFFAHKRLAGVYLHGISTSLGEELWIDDGYVNNALNAGMTEEKFLKAFRDRIDWWSSAAGVHRNKVVWVNCGRVGKEGYDCQSLNDYALSAGLGWREGGMESFQQHLPPGLGQTQLQSGYVQVDWSAPIRDGKRYFGEEVEHRMKDIHSGITDQEQTYYAQSSLMRATQLGMNYLWTSKNVINGDPAMFKWWTYIAGKNATQVPDAICWLREGYYTKSHQTVSWKNLENFVFQRDAAQAMTKPVMRVDRPSHYTDPPGVHYDYSARSTDVSNGSKAMKFVFHDSFRSGLNGAFGLKVYYFDNSTNTWRLEVPTSSGVTNVGTINGKNDYKWKIADFPHVNLPDSRPGTADYDFRFRVLSGGDLTVRFVRAIKIKNDRPVITPTPTPTPTPNNDKSVPLLLFLNINKEK